MDAAKSDAELKLVGECGLGNKRELWRVQYASHKMAEKDKVPRKEIKSFALKTDYFQGFGKSSLKNASKSIHFDFNQGSLRYNYENIGYVDETVMDPEPGGYCQSFADGAPMKFSCGKNITGALEDKPAVFKSSANSKYEGGMYFDSDTSSVSFDNSQHFSVQATPTVQAGSNSVDKVSRIPDRRSPRSILAEKRVSAPKALELLLQQLNQAQEDLNAEEARPREEVLAEKGQDWRKLDAELETRSNASRPTSSHSSRPGSSHSSRSQSPLISLQAAASPSSRRPKVNPFGDAKPREVFLELRGKDYRKMDFELEHRAVDRSETLEKQKLKEEITQEDAWVVICDYFDEKGLVHQQLDSFDEFIQNTMLEIVDESTDIEIKPESHHNPGRQADFTETVFKISFGQIYLNKPMMTESDGETATLFPKAARFRNISRPTDVPDQGSLCDLLWVDPDKDVEGWGENDIAIIVFTARGNVCKAFVRMGYNETIIVFDMFEDFLWIMEECFMNRQKVMF